MECPRCGGKGEYMREFGGYRPCEYCNGTGEVEQTNEEWFCGLTTEEKAKWIVAIIDEMGTFPDYLYSSIESKKRYWGKWLKQPHTDKE